MIVPNAFCWGQKWEPNEDDRPVFLKKGGFYNPGGRNAGMINGDAGASVHGVCERGMKPEAVSLPRALDYCSVEAASRRFAFFPLGQTQSGLDAASTLPPEPPRITGTVRPAVKGPKA
ncbi:hypothetical protein [Ereboglobus luteus]|uniref:Uncharacterized protein n=1 Tax=Ereboglobus luteus TaxID=1796921 RepID=A0A2U8E4E0_9BACT|nr:hypothetical protein [Ereboglobus luteus]AWI09414.1 hypothetical protein CKA38_09285 [Ereboglobus luteus]